MATPLRLEDFDIDPVRGFVPAQDPLLSLPAPFDAWDRIAAQLPPLIMTGRTRQVLRSLQAIDAALGIRHDHGLTKGFLVSMRDYMPPQHREFIGTVGARSLIRVAYDAAVAAMDGLRRKHSGLVPEYITKQMPVNALAVGTGGTDFDDFRRQSRIETVEAKLGAGT